MSPTQLLKGPAVSPDGCYKLSQFETQACQQLAQRATALKNGAAPETKPGKALGLLFLNPSLRTSASFQRAAARLQLELVNLNGQGVWAMESQEGAVMDSNKAEHIRDAAAVLGRFVDVLAIRAFPAGQDLDSDLADPVLRGFAKHAGVPIINMESTLWHPCQALADWATLDQHRVAKPAKFVLTWAWHPIPLPHAVANSTVCMAAQRGMQVVVLHPPGYHLHPTIMAEAEALAEANGGSVRISHDRKEAMHGAQVVYAKSWASLNTWGDAAAETAQRAPLRDWCVTSKHMPQAAKFMHCLPVRRNVVVSDEVIDGPGSLVIDQAENRLHAQTALLENLLS